MKNKPLTLQAAFDIQAAKPEEGKEPKLPTFTMKAYDGDKMVVGYWGTVVLDLAGIKAKASTPILYGHQAYDLDSVLGMTDNVTIDNAITASGTIMGEDGTADKVIRLARNGFRFQASVGVRASKHKDVGEGESVEVNGRTIEGPFTLVQAGSLYEISIVPLGADSDTETAITAEHNAQNAHKHEEKTMSEKTQKTAEDIRAEAVTEQNRILTVQSAAKDHPEIAAKAIESGWDEGQTKLAVLEAKNKALEAKIAADEEADKRPNTPNINAGSGKPAMTAEVLTAAVLQAGAMPRDRQEKLFKPETLEAAHGAFAGRMGLQQLIVTAAQASGYTGSPFLRGASDMRDAIRAAFSSTMLASTLSNAANMFIMDAYNAVEQEWAKIAKINPNVNDFREYETYADISDLTFLDLAPDGKIKHGVAKDQKHTNKLETKARIIQITRQDIINDSIGIIQAMFEKLGRGGAIALNKVFWAAFLKNTSPTFWSGTNLLASTGLDDAGLKAAFRKFSEQKDPNGDPLGVKPAYLLTGPDLEYDAERFMRSPELVAAGSTDKVTPSRNIWAGRAEAVSSQYQTEVGAYWLIADPSRLPVIEVGFLRGATAPTVETVDADADDLGISMRGFFDFGVRKQLKEAALKVTA